MLSTHNNGGAMLTGALIGAGVGLVFAIFKVIANKQEKNKAKTGQANNGK